MPIRISKLISRASKEKQAEAEAERTESNGSSPPPTYAQAPPEYDEENEIDPPDITTGFNNLNLTSSSNTPQVDQCIAHLKVLECFYRLRQKIGSTDGLFGIEDSVVLNQGLSAPDKTGQALSKLAEKRWAIYVSRAVCRFETWAAKITRAASMARNADLERVGKQGSLCEPGNPVLPLKFDRDTIPPVDILMVWHAYMLNPRSFLEDCLRRNRMPLWHTGMPWQGAVDTINSNSFAYEAGEEAVKNFTNDTNLPWDNLNDNHVRTVNCPSCKSVIKVPWTTCVESASKVNGKLPWDDFLKTVDDMLASGYGYCEQDFQASCPSCSTLVNHENLRVQRFCDDLTKLIEDDVPIKGTVLGLEGIPWKFQSVSDMLCRQSCSFPNQLLQNGLGQEILDITRRCNGDNKMTDVRTYIETKITDRQYMRKIKGLGNSRMQRTERIAIRRMMSRYWDNSSNLVIDLVGAVIRQGSFIEKMHNIDWLHSPALPSTMKRLLLKYTRFVDMMSDRYNMHVPTLDVDLAWHTHQLSPYNYMKYTVATTRRFIDHDDKVAETVLNDAFARTSKTYQKRYGEPYSECTCWYCEAVRESHTNAASRLFNSKSSQANERLHAAEQDPKKSVHISAHNAVRPSDGNYDADAAIKKDQLEKQYEKACERARKKGKIAPRRDDYYYSDAWGYPVAWRLERALLEIAAKVLAAAELQRAVAQELVVVLEAQLAVAVEGARADVVEAEEVAVEVVVAVVAAAVVERLHA